MNKNKFEIEINGCIQTNLNEDEFYNAFIVWIEENGWFFGGGINEYIATKTPDVLNRG